MLTEHILFTAASSLTILPNSSVPPNLAAAPADNTLIIAAVVIVLAVASIAIIAVILVIVVIIRKKRKGKANLTNSSPDHIQMMAVNNNLDNPMYSGTYVIMQFIDHK